MVDVRGAYQDKLDHWPGGKGVYCNPGHDGEATTFKISGKSIFLSAVGGKGADRHVGGNGGSGGGAGASTGGCGSENGGGGGSDGDDGGTAFGKNSPGSGQGSTTRAFGHNGGELFSGGGGGSSCNCRHGSSGSGGGADPGKNAAVNTGGGGGAGGADNSGGCLGSTGKGGSGIIKIRYKPFKPSPIPSKQLQQLKLLLHLGQEQKPQVRLEL